jgi:uncharacterized protein (TIGR03790 family)
MTLGYPCARYLLVTTTVLSLAAPGRLSAATPRRPLSNRTLVVYDSTRPDSESVARYYAAARSIPDANLCAIATPSPVWLTYAQFASTVLSPVQVCLDAVGRTNILYIVFAYDTPYKVIGPDGEGYAIDSVMADAWDAVAPTYNFPSGQPYFADSASEAGEYVRFLSFDAFRGSSPAPPTFYAVWRLDGADASVARELVDRALAAESVGVSGQGCFDLRHNIATRDDFDYGAVDWDIYRAAGFFSAAGFPVVEDESPQEFGTAPAPARCDGAAFYAGWYSYNHYNDAFTWNTGAIGFHLDSAAALDPRGGPNWAANALVRGITATSGAIAEPYLEGLVRVDGVFRNLLEGANIGDAVLRNSMWMKWRVLNIGDPLYRPFPGGRAPFDSPSEADDVQLGSSSVVGGDGTRGWVLLTAPAPAGGAVVALTSTNETAASVPPSVMVVEGATKAMFPIATAGVTANVNVTLSASYGGSVPHKVLVVSPLLASIGAPESVTGGATVRAIVSLAKPAPSGGIAVPIASSSPLVTPSTSTVTIPGGQTYASFNVTTQPVASEKGVTLRAVYAGAKRTTTLQLLPPSVASITTSASPVHGGAKLTLAIALTGPAPAGGVSVALTSSAPNVLKLPASVAIAAGASHATVTVTTAAVTASRTVTATATLNGAKHVAIGVRP